MLAEPGRGTAERARGCRQARHDVVHRQAARLRVREVDQDLALGDIRVGGEVGLVADRADRHLGPFEKGERFAPACARR